MCCIGKGARLSAVLGVFLAVTIAACGGKTGKGPNAVATESEIGEATLTVHAVDFSFKLDKQTVPAGEVRIVLINDSKDYQHEVFIYPQNQPKLQAMVSLKESGTDVAEKDYLQGIAGDVEDVPPGQRATFDVTLQPGAYELSCFGTSTIAGKSMNHYSMGMHAVLTVTAQ